jgi:malonyl-CoA/methylmalonyl-CoA synthetase
MANPLYDALFGAHSENSEAFLILPDGKEISYKSFVAMAAGYASAITDLGLVAGDRLAIQVEKSPQALALIAGCIQAGIVFVPLNTGYTGDEMAYFVENSGAKLLVCDGARADALASIDVLIETMNADGSGSFAAKAKAATGFETVARSGGDLAAFLHTSGTTGRSKGAMLSQDNLLSNARTLVREWRFDRSDVLLHALPIFHAHGLFVATNVMLLVGGKMIFLPKFDLDQMIDLMPQATSLMGVPTFYTRLLNDARFTRDVAHHMRLFVSGSAPLLSETHVQFEERTGHRILERYGMTETSMNT